MTTAHARFAPRVVIGLETGLLYPTSRRLLVERSLDQSLVLCTNIKSGDMLWVTSELGKCECWAYAQSLHEFGLMVSLELDNHNPTMQEAMADGGLEYDQVELVEVIPFSAIRFCRRLSGDIPVRVWKRRYTSSERAQRAKLRGFTRVALPELDAHFNTRRR